MQDNLRQLVKLVNEEMDATVGETRQRLDTMISELGDVHRRLERVYDALETGALSLSDLAPRIHALRHREDQLQAARLDLEELLARRRIELADDGTVRRYVENLRDVLTESPLTEQRAFIRGFVKEVKLTGNEVLLTYTIPLPPARLSRGTAEVLDIVQHGGPYRTISRTFSLAFSI